ncbi:MAG: GrpB family protein [Longimicrobiales bacterium]
MNDEQVIVVDYDPNWTRVFETLRARIWRAVADIAVSIEHVGSTAVPGLAAKPVIDLDVVVPEREISLGIARLAAVTTIGETLGCPSESPFEPPAEHRAITSVCAHR